MILSVKFAALEKDPLALCFPKCFQEFPKKLSAKYQSTLGLREHSFYSLHLNIHQFWDCGTAKSLVLLTSFKYSSTLGLRDFGPRTRFTH